MDDWEMKAFKISRTIAKTSLNNQEKLINYNGELAVGFESYAPLDFAESTLYFSAPEQYRRSQIKSYGGNLKYKVTYSG